tara:strand:- start:4100 stop:4267 length:168 start_codon:yes stop_codon:yes gene_type:complete
MAAPGREAADRENGVREAALERPDRGIGVAAARDIVQDAYEIGGDLGAAMAMTAR